MKVQRNGLTFQIIEKYPWYEITDYRLLLVFTFSDNRAKYLNVVDETFTLKAGSAVLRQWLYNEVLPFKPN